MTVTATERLSRLLAMVPFLLQRQGIPLAEAAAEFGISEAQLVQDLQLLFVCGAPGHLPDDLIDASWEDGQVYLSNAEAIARPLRLGVDEALALLVGLRALAQVPGLDDRSALDRAVAKLEAAAGDAAAASAHVAVTVDQQGTALPLLRDALARGRRVHLSYFVAARDETTERDVDPMRLLLVDGRWYLEGWCRRAESVRLFRLDRVESVQELELPAEVPPDARARDLDSGIFQAAPEDTRVTLEVRPEAAWITEYYPVESVEALPGGAQQVTLRVADDRWLHQLLLRLGGAAWVVRPPELAHDVAERAALALRHYEGEPAR